MTEGSPGRDAVIKHYSQDTLREKPADNGRVYWLSSKHATPETAIGKNYMYKRQGIPSMTYEVGDETSRADASAAARVFAEEFMRLLLEAAH